MNSSLRLSSLQRHLRVVSTPASDHVLGFVSRALTFVAFSGLCVTILLAFCGCGSKNKTAKEHAANLPATKVQVSTAENKLRTMTEDVAGTLLAKWRATLEAKVSGRIEKLPVALGTIVQKGQLIARLDAVELAARLEQAEASLEQAERELKRVATLFEQRSATRAEYDSTLSRQRIAKGALAEAKALMSYVEIVAPFDGVVTKKWADVGDLATPGKPLVDIEDPSSLQLEANVPETIVLHIEKNSRLGVRVEATKAELEGVVAEIAPAADAATRTFRVKLDLPPSAGLMSGQFARLAVPIGERKSVRVPVSAAIQRGQLEMVFTVTNQRARLHLVKTGRRVGDEIEILSGLNGGESIVVSGAEQLKDDQPVEVW